MEKAQAVHYIGIDIGATWIKTGIVARDGKLVSNDNFETIKLAGPGHFLSISGNMIELLLKENGIRRESVGAIGVGAPGWTNHSEGIVHELTNIAGWQDIPLAEQLERVTGLRTFVDNDANVMAVGEMLHGAGRGYRNFICLTLGTGVGGAIVVDGEIYRGARGLAGEIGHMTLDLDGPKCACGAKGCLERYVGNRFIVANALSKLEETSADRTESIILDIADQKPENITPRVLSMAAAKGDEIAIKVWSETGYYLGVALAVLVNLLNPECFIIGGGVARAGAVLFDPMRKTVERLAMNELGKTTPVFEAKLKEDAGIIGAAMFAMSCVEKA